MSFEDVDKFFIKRWNEIEDVVDYNPDWERKIRPLKSVHLRVVRTGKVIPRTPPEFETSLDDVVDRPDAPAVGFGRVVKTMDDHGRRVIFVGTRLGLAVVYEHGGVRAKYSKRLEETNLVPFWYITSDVLKLANLIGGTLPDGDGFIQFSNLGLSFETAYRLMNEPK